MFIDFFEFDVYWFWVVGVAQSSFGIVGDWLLWWCGFGLWFW